MHSITINELVDAIRDEQYTIGSVYHGEELFMNLKAWPEDMPNIDLIIMMDFFKCDMYRKFRLMVKTGMLYFNEVKIILSKICALMLHDFAKAAVDESIKFIDDHRMYNFATGSSYFNDTINNGIESFSTTADKLQELSNECYHALMQLVDPEDDDRSGNEITNDLLHSFETITKIIFLISNDSYFPKERDYYAILESLVIELRSNQPNFSKAIMGPQTKILPKGTPLTEYILAIKVKSTNIVDIEETKKEK